MRLESAQDIQLFFFCYIISRLSFVTYGFLDEIYRLVFKLLFTEQDFLPIFLVESPTFELKYRFTKHAVF